MAATFLIGLFLGMVIMLIERALADKEYDISRYNEHVLCMIRKELDRADLNESQTDRVRHIAQEELMTHDDLIRMQSEQPMQWPKMLS